MSSIPSQGIWYGRTISSAATPARFGYSEKKDKLLKRLARAEGQVRGVAVFADLLILPILDIYRRYYGWKMAGFIFATFYAAMATAGLVVEFLFQGLGLEPTARNAKVVTARASWNYTTYLNIVFLALAALLVWRYFRRGGGWAMLKMMDEPLGDDHDHHEHDYVHDGHVHVHVHV